MEPARTEETRQVAQRQPRASLEGASAHFNHEGELIITNAQGQQIPTRQRLSLALAVFLPSAKAQELCDFSADHVRTGDGLPRSAFARVAGSGVVGLVTVTNLDDIRSTDRPEDLADGIIPLEYKGYTTSRNIPLWENTCGFNRDWLQLYAPNAHVAPAGEAQNDVVLVSGVELPVPNRGYPNLDILGLMAKTRTNNRFVLARLQERAIIEGGVAIHQIYLVNSVISIAAQSLRPSQQIPVLFVTVTIPEDARIIEIVADEDWNQRLLSHYSTVRASLPENFRFIAIVPEGTDLTNPEARDFILPRHQTRMLRCRDCGQDFEFSEKDQLYFQAKGFDDPIRCKQCQQANKAQRDRRREENDDRRSWRK